MQKHIIIEQHWHDFDRVIIIDTSLRGSVSLELYHEQQKFGGTCWLYALFVNVGARHIGIGKDLLQAAEIEARKRGHLSVCLDWTKKDSPEWVLDWYLRNGYDEKQFDGSGQYSLLEKMID